MRTEMKTLHGSSLRLIMQSRHLTVTWYKKGMTPWKENYNTKYKVLYHKQLQNEYFLFLFYFLFFLNSNFNSIFFY